jgi:dephospho-CoA kinase
MAATAQRIGLTGGIGSGKSTVAALFAALGAAVIDSDAIARELTAPGGAAIEAVRAAFGAAMIDAQGAMDRARMRERVLSDAAARRRLEGILHPMIRARSELLAREAQGRFPVLIFEIPLLAEGGAARAREGLDRILVVDCPPERQLAHACARGTMPPEQVRAVMASQAGRRARLDVADDILVNAGTLDALRARVALLWTFYRDGGPRPAV